MHNLELLKGRNWKDDVHPPLINNIKRDELIHKKRRRESHAQTKRQNTHPYHTHTHSPTAPHTDTHSGGVIGVADTAKPQKNRPKTAKPQQNWI